MNGAFQENGVADILGAIVLVSVVTFGIVIAASAILSNPVPQKIPALNIDVKNTSSTVYLTHNGGDSLHKGEYRILVDGQDRTTSFLKGGTAAGDWSAGETLEYKPSNGKIPGSFQIVYTGGGISQVLVQVFT